MLLFRFAVRVMEGPKSFVTEGHDSSDAIEKQRFNVGEPLPGGAIRVPQVGCRAKDSPAWLWFTWNPEASAKTGGRTSNQNRKKIGSFTDWLQSSVPLRAVCCVAKRLGELGE